MALNTYADLKAAVATWLNRDSLTSQIPDFIRLAEARIYRELRIPNMEVTTTLSISGSTGKANVPSDFLEARSVTLSTGETLLRKPYDEVAARANTNTHGTGQPKYWARVGQEFIVSPFPDAGTYNLNLYYYQQPTNLSDSNQTNYLTNQSPDLLLFGALTEAGVYLKDNEVTAVWEQKFQAAMAAVMRESAMVEWGGYGHATQVA